MTGKIIYTERVPKIGILTRRRHEFEPGLAGAEAAQLIKLGDAGGFKVIGCQRRQKPIFETRSVYLKIKSISQFCHPSCCSKTDCPNVDLFPPIIQRAINRAVGF